MCTPLLIGGIAMAGAGAAMQAHAAGQRAAATKAALYRDADVAERQAADAVSRGVVPGVRAAIRGGKVIGTQEAHYAASGVAVGTGSAGDVTAETRIVSSLDEEIIRNNAAREAYGYRTEAQHYRQQGENAEAEGKNAILASVIGGVGRMAMIGAKGWLEMPAEPVSPDARILPAQTGSFDFNLNPTEMYS